MNNPVVHEKTIPDPPEELNQACLHIALDKYLHIGYNLWTIINNKPSHSEYLNQRQVRTIQRQVHTIPRRLRTIQRRLRTIQRRVQTNCHKERKRKEEINRSNWKENIGPIIFGPNSLTKKLRPIWRKPKNYFNIKIIYFFNKLIVNYNYMNISRIRNSRAYFILVRYRPDGLSGLPGKNLSSVTPSMLLFHVRTVRLVCALQD